MLVSLFTRTLTWSVYLLDEYSVSMLELMCVVCSNNHITFDTLFVLFASVGKTSEYLINP